MFLISASMFHMTKRVSSTLVFARMSNGEICNFHVFFSDTRGNLT